MRGQKGLWLHQNYLYLCSKDPKKQRLWNNTRVSDWWQNCRSLGNYPYKQWMLTWLHFISMCTPQSIPSAKTLPVYLYTTQKCAFLSRTLHIRTQLGYLFFKTLTIIMWQKVCVLGSYLLIFVIHLIDRIVHLHQKQKLLWVRSGPDGIFPGESPIDL